MKNKFSMTSCTKPGIKIRNSDNEYTHDPFADYEIGKSVALPPPPLPSNKNNIQYDQSKYEMLDLNIEHYSREELYKLFGFRTSIILTEDSMKEARKIVLKTHPDKCRLDNKYFIFFNKAYKRLHDIFEFQNKTSSKKIDTNDYFEKENVKVLDKMFDNKKDLKDPSQFNDWFNAQFEKNRLEDPVENGYGNWLQSDEDIVYTPQNITKDSMAREMEKRKKQIQTITTYSGVGSSFGGSSAGGSALMEYNSNFSSGSLFGGDGIGYTDLRQAYVESVIPVTEDDFTKMQKFRNVDEYRRNRDSVDITPLNKEESMRMLYHQESKDNEESAALAFYYAKQSEKVKNNADVFWSGLKQLTNS